MPADPPRPAPRVGETLRGAVDTNTAAGWRAHAEALAARDLEHCANRVDVWGQFRPMHRREVAPDGTVQRHWTMPARARRGLEYLTHATLVRHYIGADVGDVVGLHCVGADSFARWLAFDFDNHEGSAEQGARNLRVAAEL